MKALQNRVCLVTGAAQGLGATIARTFCEHGAQIIVTDINPAVHDLAAQLPPDSEATAFEHDVSSEDCWKDIIAAIVERFGALDVVVNNAGIVINAPVWQTSLDQWRTISRINLDGVFLGTKHAILAMKDSKRRSRFSGSIINMSSVGGLRGAAGLSAYCMTKGGVRLFTKAVAAECGPFNIRVNTIHPGTIATDMGMSALRPKFPNMSDEDIKRSAGAAYPLGRIGTPNDIASAAVFLASDAAAYITGMEMVVDGGLTAKG